MNDIISLTGSRFSEMFEIKMFYQAPDVLCNRTHVYLMTTIFLLSIVLRINSVYVALNVYLLTLSFLLFLILSIIHINCASPDSNHLNSAVIGAKDSHSNFLPDENDIRVIDEAYEAVVPRSIHEMATKNSDTSDREALMAVKMALKLKKNEDKARKLFEHAMALSPNHLDVLLHYGEFLESTKDFINADHFYLKALILRPKDPTALVNRERVLPVVNQLDLEVLNRIDSKQFELINLDRKDPSLKQLKKELYFQHIHHTVAIEGNTMTLDETQTVVETRMPVAGKSIIEYNEILGVDNAFRYVNQTLVNKSDITVKDILEIHQRVMGHVDPTIAGTFRTTQVFVGHYTPPSADEIEGLMDELVGLLQSPEVINMHPTQVAATAHFKLVDIHPFFDGNGRTARLLMNLIFLKYRYPAVLIKKEQRDQYFNLLQVAHESDIRPFCRFIAFTTEYTIDAFLFASQNLRQRTLESASNVTDVIPLRI